MIWVKIAGCILVLFSTSGIGFLYAGEIKRRQEDIRALRKIAMLLRGDIKYAGTPLPEAFENIAKRHEGRLSLFVNELSEKLSMQDRKSFTDIWGQAEEKLSYTSLNHKDKELLHQLGNSLGYLDKEMQINTIDLYLDQSEENLKELSEDMSSRMHLLKSIGIMAGIFVILLIV